MTNITNLDEFNEYFQNDFDKRYLRDGVYDVSNLEVLILDGCEGDIIEEHWQQVKEFIDKNPKWVFASPYQINTSFLVSEMPHELSKNNIFGNGFNYGSGNLIVNCPSKILILAEDD